MLIFFDPLDRKKTRQGLKKRSSGPEKKTHQGLYLLSGFQAREKKTLTGLFFLIFVYERHQSHYASAFDSCCYFTLVLG